MIRRLLIRNYAIIDELEIAFSDRFTIITGETGAGKSILLGALGLIMGRRADTKTLLDDTRKCVVEGRFDVSGYDLGEFFETNDLDYDEEVVIRREITPSGKSRAFINDTPARLPMLQQLTASLVDLHRQFDTLDIHNVSFQLRMVDALAGNKRLVSRYQDDFRRYRTNQTRLQKLRQAAAEAARETEFLQFQLNELAEAELTNGEQEAAEQELATLNNAEEIKRVTGAVFGQLSDNETSIVSQLNDLLLNLRSIAQYDAATRKVVEQLESQTLEIEELGGELERIAEDTEYDGERIRELTERLDLIYQLQSKHNVTTVAELLQLQAAMEARLGQFADVSEEIIKLESLIEKQTSALTEKAQVLSERRANVTDSFVAQVEKMLAQLNMQHARLQIQIERLPELTATGFDQIEFFFAPNMGSRYLPIKDVASGGELSRLTLCIKSLVASAIPLPTMIFDEIDTGISGDVALKMGSILSKLASEHQIVSISHTPQIAARADAHYFVYKYIADNRTLTRVRLLTKDERVTEIATMLSGNPPSEAALENAKSLLV